MKRLPTKLEISQCQKPTPWDFGNSILYDLCTQDFGHQEMEKILAKVWLIGRSYSVSIERRKNKQNKKESSETFYIEVAMPAMQRLHLGPLLSGLKCHETITPDNAIQILEVHQCLTQCLESITELDKRSFSSKYLHFHLPELFFIYDNRALTGMRVFVDRVPKDLQSIAHAQDTDAEYAKFTCKCLELKRQIARAYGIDLTNRQLQFVAGSCR